MLMPIWLVLRLCWFPKAFADHLVYPLVALFFGTGNQTPYISAAVVARVFLDPDMKLFDYDPKRLLSQSPEMFAFDSLRDIYRTIADRIPATKHFSRGVRGVRREASVVHVTDHAGVTEQFDEIIFACNAETALAALDAPRFWERWALGNVRYYNDITITHTDENYIKALYDVDQSRGDQYYVRTYPSDPSAIEMSFSLHNYQPQIARPIYQTIFLDDGRRTLWTDAAITSDKILLTKKWRQFSHTWRHFAFTVPFMRLLQGRERTWYCGGYTVFNTHEMAITSGLAVAHRLGAPYPFAHDPLAAQQFDQLLSISHGCTRK